MRRKRGKEKGPEGDMTPALHEARAVIMVARG